ncbi:MAG: indole-3-glycerol-phosphate synthase TrpC [Gammaproteobacteria bacterium]|nr:indole-3-glycerol-phosphate synthase TrpC [Gammaproteobacteria bacterium]NNM21583.1 indole-3-glycerol-phosphate synthase TrpC [Gammaproteobacteria bacterium]
MSDFLETMRASSLQRARHAMAQRPLKTVVQAALQRQAAPALTPSAKGFDIIGEVKRSSPAHGELSAESVDALVDRARAYARAGAVAVSVLTEPQRFGGDLAHLEKIAHGLHPLGVPAMRKDFIVDVYQVWEAAAAGAGGVLLILRLLDDFQINSMIEAAARAKMFVLLEAFDGSDLRRARNFVQGHPQLLVGLNARNLATLEVEFERLPQLAGKFPPGCVRVAESGMASNEQVREVAQAGYAMALVGTALMKQRQPAKFLQDLLIAGRRSIAG